jgi:hypothetical protein
MLNRKIHIAYCLFSRLLKIEVLKMYIFLILVLSLFNCKQNTPPNTTDQKLKYNIDKNFLIEIDTTNFQFIYENSKISNFNKKYFIDVFSKSTQSCLYCLVNTETNLLTPLPVWSCNVKFNYLSDTIVVTKDTTVLKYKWDEAKTKFILLH